MVVHRSSAFLKRLLGAVPLVGALLAGPAHAVVLANPGEAITLSGPLRSGSFLDVYTFSLSGPLGLNDSSTYTSFTGFSTVTGYSARLFTATGVAPLIAGTDGPPGPRQTANTFYAPVLAAGDYRLEIAGIGGGLRGGSYAGTLTALAPVPEARTWTMLIAGLSLLGTLAWRRRSFDAQGVTP
jgi:hypothetical protein